MDDDIVRGEPVLDYDELPECFGRYVDGSDKCDLCDYAFFCEEMSGSAEDKD